MGDWRCFPLNSVIKLDGVQPGSAYYGMDGGESHALIAQTFMETAKSFTHPVNK